jgi:aldose 1-epimerase
MPGEIMSITTKPFGSASTFLYTLINKNGMELSLTNIGASMTRIVVPSKGGRKTDVLLGYDSADAYRTSSSFHGATVGRYANRIGGAAIRLDGVTFNLDKNEGKNVLHGGFDPYSRRIWSAEAKTDGTPSVTFSIKSPDGDQGLPGTADVAVTYSLTEDDSVVIHYDAAADKKTVFNLTNHAYFNLDGHDAGSIADQRLWLDCDLYAAINSEFIPTGELLSVKGTPMDFTEGKPIGRDIESKYEQIALGNGYDHNYVINGPSLATPFAVARSAKTGIEMRVYTDLPGVQFYSGNNMGLDSHGKDGAKYPRRGAFCLETQHFPDAPNKPSFPSAVFDAGQRFDSTTIYKFLKEEKD